MAAQDPFYLVRDEIQDSVSKVQDDYSKWERLGASSQERETLSKTILADTETLEWELEELDRVIGVAERDPSRFNIEQGEVESRRKWTGSTRDQISMIRSAIQAAASERAAMQKEAERRELLRVQAGAAAKAAAKSNAGGENESFAASEDDRQALIMREQDDQLDAMSQSLARIGGMGIAIHEELGSQVSYQVVRWVLRWSGGLPGGHVGIQVVSCALRNFPLPSMFRTRINLLSPLSFLFPPSLLPDFLPCLRLLRRLKSQECFALASTYSPHYPSTFLPPCCPISFPASAF
ncbi:unnamed protein product [Closterium sp. Naga37s-1]|nr:unnamed protein product [Closterium sp. Naga37s-1]